MNNPPQLIDEGNNFEIAGLVHRIRLPKGSGPHPVVVMLHGHLGNEDVMWVFGQTLPSSPVIVAPRAIVPVAEKSFTWLSRVENEWPTMGQFEDVVTAVTTFIHTLPSLYQVDLNQIYLMGFSQGAALAFAIAAYMPGWIKGIASLVGFMPLRNEEFVRQAALRDVPVFMAVGTQDERIPLTISQSSAEAVRAMGAFLEYREYETGHKLDATGMRKLKSWWGEQLI